MTVGDIVSVKFWDHCQDSLDPVSCTVWGKVVHTTPLSVSIICWEVEDEEGQVGYNNTIFTILLSCIIKVKTYRRVASK